MPSGYLVKCPQLRCDWFGRLQPSTDADAWSAALSTTEIAGFECPCCQHEWQAYLVGGQAVPVPLDDDEDLEFAVWPPVEIGVGD